MNYTNSQITEMAKTLFKTNRAKKRLDGWFISKRAELEFEKENSALSGEMRKAKALCKIAEILPLNIDENQIFAGTQDDGFARSYALINPSFKVEEFSGYCDPTAVFGDIEPSEEIPAGEIERVRNEFSKTDYVKQLDAAYAGCENYTKEVAFFVEQVTGHLIPDFRAALKLGVLELKKQLEEKGGAGREAFSASLDAVLILADRYRTTAQEQLENATGDNRARLEKMVEALERVPRYGARDLYEAIQSFILLWQVMCLEQTPNPFAFSVGNADRIFEPYRNGLDRESAAALFKHLLVFYNVADRSWAISQNVILSGRDKDGNDLTNECTYALLDAYYDMNLPQPILSVKLHKNTPQKLYRELGRFFFSAGVLTPSLFNDDSLYEVLSSHGVDVEDLPDISVAGCQEPLIMGKDNGNTTNSWLNLPKVLELTLTGGYSTITGEKLVEFKKADLKNIKEEFFKNLEVICDEMAKAANAASCALSNLRVPFLSCFMGGIETGIDLRDTQRQGTKYNGSGCLIHGTSVVADSLTAIEKLLNERPQDADKLIDALKADFKGYEELKDFLFSADKFGNGIKKVDELTAEIADRAADIVAARKNYLGNSFRPDFSSPSTHLLYGYWVGATPDGRPARDMINYGVDPLYGSAENGLGLRTLSVLGLPFNKMNGGYASHLGVDPKYFTADTYEEKGMEFYSRIVKPLFFNEMKKGVSPFYLYVNVTTPEILRKVLANPEKYAPSGIYIMRIHGTFVNFLDLSPAIQQDIIKRLDPKSASIGDCQC
ncbi:MAG: hypothetical protein MJ177_03085 [Clostridia bacterium]|nr:hypothetical protein [Clostridia bacterium]